MARLPCEICHIRLPTSKKLIMHYLGNHSKFKLARELFKLSLKNRLPKLFSKKIESKPNYDGSTVEVTKLHKTETVFANESVQIFCRNNEIIIKDDRSSVDMEFSFDESSNEEADNFFISENTSNKTKITDIKMNNNSNEGNELRKLLTSEQEKRVDFVNMPSSSASSEDSCKKFSFKKKLRKRKDLRDKTRHYKISITRTRNEKSLDETTGRFYQCHCSQDKENLVQSLQEKLTSDTESSSDTGKAGTSSDAKVFCNKCGNGYKDKNGLMEHMKSHETHCRVCDEMLPTKQLFKEHIQKHIFKVFVCHICKYEFPVRFLLLKHFESHMEESILDNVLDMEEDYQLSGINIAPSTLSNGSYQSSINNILSYIQDKCDMYGNSTKQPLVECAICLAKIYCAEYELHMQNVHGIYECR